MHSCILEKFRLKHFLDNSTWHQTLLTSTWELRALRRLLWRNWVECANWRGCVRKLGFSKQPAFKMPYPRAVSEALRINTCSRGGLEHNKTETTTEVIRQSMLRLSRKWPEGSPNAQSLQRSSLVVPWVEYSSVHVCAEFGHWGKRTGLQSTRSRKMTESTKTFQLCS